MAQKSLREVTAKQLLRDHFPGKVGKPIIDFIAINEETDLDALPISQKKCIVKVDELFGKRGKLGYVKVCKDSREAAKWIKKHRGKEVEVGSRKGILQNFIIEPFIEHKKEYYLAFTAERERDVILFSLHGGIEVENSEHEPLRITVKLDEKPNVKELPEEIRKTVLGLFETWRRLDFAFLEINPLTVARGNVYLLDAVCRVDTCAAFQQRDSWGGQSLPQDFGSALVQEEIAIAALDAKTGASLKFVLLNERGKIWTMVAGGGASIIYADAILSQVAAKELANYGEWSGNPSTDEMEAYTENILELMTHSSGEQALIIGGGIANFTDIAKTFAGVIRALRKYRERLGNVKVYVRRAGPNDQIGLAALQSACDEMGIACVTHGAELPMTDIVGMAVEDLQLSS